MGFSIKKLTQAVTNTTKTVLNPVKMTKMVGDLHELDRPTLDNLFKKIDPVLDALSPSHQIVQEMTTGQTTTEKQSPYFQKIAPMIVNAFFPGAGSAAAAVSNAAEGNYKGAAINAAGAAGGYFAGSGGWTGVGGKALLIGVGAYQVVDMAGATKGYYGAPPPNMVSTTQQAAPVYFGASAGTPYGRLTGAQDEGALHAAAAAQLAADQEARNKNLLLLAAFAFMTWAVITGEFQK